MGSYLINTSTNAAVTVNLIQGRVLLEPLTYCELHDQDKARARQVYNSKELNLFVAESEKELELILKNKETLQKMDLPEETETQEGSLENEESHEDSESNEENSLETETTTEQAESTEETVDSESTEQNETVITDPEEADVQKDASDESASEESKEDSDIIEGSTSAEAPSQEVLERAKNRQKVVDAINIYRSQGNLRALKEMASKLGIHFMHNIGFNALAAKILEHIDKQ